MAAATPPIPPPEYRRDPVTGRRVIIAPERSFQPLALSHSAPTSRRDAERDTCPFCEGQEAETPEELYSIRPRGIKSGGPGWKLRVVPNKFPAVRPISGVEFLGTGQLFQSFPGFGTHEVVVECPQHLANPTELSDTEFGEVFVAYRERLYSLSQDRRVTYVAAFKNVGAEAGASLAHTHSQLIAMPVVPDSVRMELEGGHEYYRQTGRCVICDILDADLADGSRIVASSDHFVAITAFAGRFAYETWVVPTTHSSKYEDLRDDYAYELAALMKLVLGKIDHVLGYPAYNYYLHTGPARANDLPYYHWHVEIVPRTVRPAGFEWGSGCFINSVLPEEAAGRLRVAEPATGK